MFWLLNEHLGKILQACLRKKNIFHSRHWNCVVIFMLLKTFFSQFFSYIQRCIGLQKSQFVFFQNITLQLQKNMNSDY